MSTLPEDQAIPTKSWFVAIPLEYQSYIKRNQVVSRRCHSFLTVNFAPFASQEERFLA
jgi:hypothetical protein